MKKHIDEVMKKSSALPACVIMKNWNWHIVSESNCIMARTENVSSVSHGFQKHNAALIAHCLNNFQPLLDALKYARENPNELNRIAEAIEAAEQVEVPE